MHHRQADLLHLLLLLCTSFAYTHAGTLSATVGSDAAVSVTLDGTPWLSSGDYFVRSAGKVLSTSDGSLAVKDFASFDGTDKWGDYHSTNFKLLSSGGDVGLLCSVLTYKSGRAVRFRQTAYSSDGAITGTASGDKDALVSGFPSFKVDSITGQSRGAFAFAGDMTGYYDTAGIPFDNSTKALPGGISGTGPIVLFTQDLRLSTVLSPMSNFMAASQYFDASTMTLSYGVMGNVSELPAGFEVDTVVFSSSGGGINDAMDEWGAAMRYFYGKADDVVDNDFTLTHLGYSTDNGAYYYYHTETNKNYEQTILDIKSYASEQNIPYRHILLDSWWYFKGIGNGVKEWLARPDIFPDGLDYVFNQTQWPIVGHNRYWAADNVYAKQNGGKWDFVIQSPKALPLEQEFWDWLMMTSRQWGLKVYEQDWLDNEFDDLPALTQNASLGRRWLMQMGSAAARNGLTIQYCMSHVRHILQSLEIPAVTQARASNDYASNHYEQWNVGYSGMLARAVGIAPSKDNYWSTSVQPGNPYDDGRTEPFCRLQSAVSTLSRGPVAPSDMVGGSDRKLIMRACMSDGTLLRPSRIASSIDAQIVQQTFATGGPQGQVWSTVSNAGGRVFGHVLVAELQADYQLTPTDFGLSQDGKYAVWESNFTDSQPMHFSSFSPLTAKACGSTDFQLWHATPLEANGWAIIGEVDKWIPTSADRIVNIDETPDTLGVSVRGPPGETVQMVFWRYDANTTSTVSCTVDHSGTVMLVAGAPQGQECVLS